MPNWCLNVVEFFHEDKREINRIAKIARAGGLLEAMSPSPRDKDGLDLHFWRLENWGTKWDVGEIESISKTDEGNRVELAFDTANGPPIAWYEKLTEFQIVAYYFEEGTGSCGKWTLENGEEQYYISDSDQFDDIVDVIPEDIIEKTGISEFFDRRSEDEGIPTKKLLERANFDQSVAKAIAIADANRLRFFPTPLARALRGDREVVQAILDSELAWYKWPTAYADPLFRSDANIFLDAIKQGRRNNALRVADKKLLNDINFIIEAIALSEAAGKNASTFGIFKTASRNVKAALSSDRNFVLSHLDIYSKASKSIRADREIALAAVSHFGGLLAYVPRELKSDKEIVLAAVRQSGSALEYAAKRLRNDPDVVTAAVCQDGSALEYASSKLKKVRNIVAAAVANQASSLEFAAKEFHSDIEILCVAIGDSLHSVESFVMKSTRQRRDEEDQYIDEDDEYEDGDDDEDDNTSDE